MGKPTTFEWQQISSHLARLQDGEKLHKKALYSKYHYSPCPYQTDFSFINIKGMVIAIDNERGFRVIGKGTFGTVKYAYDKNGKRYALKIESADEMLPSEQAILNDLGILVGETTRYRLPKKSHRKTSKPKHYSLMEDLGTNLNKHLKTQKPSDSARLKLAIDIALKVHELHSGKASKSGKKYAHGDLKPANVTLTKAGGVELIDFGCTVENPAAPYPYLQGTPLYLESCPKGKIARQIDILALQRILHLPQRFRAYDAEQNQVVLTTRLENKDSQFVLTDTLMDKKKLRQYIDTSSTYRHHSKKIKSAKKLAAVLILAYCGFENDYYLLDKKEVKKALLNSLIEAYQHPPSEGLKAKVSQLITDAKMPAIEKPAPIKTVKSTPTYDLGKTYSRATNPGFFKAANKDVERPLITLSTYPVLPPIKKTDRQKAKLSTSVQAKILCARMNLPQHLNQFYLSTPTYQKMLSLTNSHEPTLEALKPLMENLWRLSVDSSFKPLYTEVFNALEDTFNKKPSPSDLKQLKLKISSLFLYTPSTRYAKSLRQWNKLSGQLTTQLKSLCHNYELHCKLAKPKAIKKALNRYEVLPPVGGFRA